jgi:hypothetical protein
MNIHVMKSYRVGGLGFTWAYIYGDWDIDINLLFITINIWKGSKKWN